MKTKKQRSITIGPLAKSAGVGVETVRFYERKGLLQQPLKTSGVRHYSSYDIKKIKFIRKAKTLGFSLDEVKELMELSECSDKTRELMQQKSAKKIQEVTQKIDDLKKMLESLQQFSDSCGKSDHQSCDLIECFENNWECCLSPHSI